MDFITTKTILPGQPGSIKEWEKYGDKLICVRYKVDPISDKKIKTVELIVDRKNIKNTKKRIPYNKKVFVKIEYSERQKRRTAKSLGAVWNSKRKLWKMQYGDVYNLNWEDRIVD